MQYAIPLYNGEALKRKKCVDPGGKQVLMACFMYGSQARQVPQRAYQSGCLTDVTFGPALYALVTMRADPSGIDRLHASCTDRFHLLTAQQFLLSRSMAVFSAC